MECDSVKSTYQKVNITIATVLSVVLLLLFLGVITGLVQCPFQSQFGIACSACGMSRDFMNFLSLDFSSPINKHSFSIFIFFASQIILRPIIFLSKKKFSQSHVLSDLTLSSIWALWVFGRLLF